MSWIGKCCGIEPTPRFGMSGRCSVDLGMPNCRVSAELSPGRPRSPGCLVPARTAVARAPLTPGQMSGQHLGCQQEVAVVSRLPALAPAALRGRHPARLAFAGVLPANGVHISPRREECGIELELRLLRSCVPVAFPMARHEPPHAAPRPLHPISAPLRYAEMLSRASTIHFRISLPSPLVGRPVPG